MKAGRAPGWTVLCRVAMHLYPASIRARLGVSIVRTFDDRVRDARGRGRSYAAAVAACELGDVVRNALAARFGNTSISRAPRSHGRGAQGLESIVADVRYAIRALRKRPGFATLAVVILGIGIGASTAVFSVVDSALLRPLPFRDADRIVEVWRLLPGGGRVTSWKREDLEIWTTAELFDQVVGWDFEEVDLTAPGEPRVLNVARVEPATLAFLGERPAIGRDFVDADGLQGAEPVAMLADGLARQLAGTPRAAIDTWIELDGVRHRVVAVAPPRFSYPLQGVSAWVPVSLLGADSRMPELRPRVYARIKAGASATTATDRGNVIAERAGVEQRLFLSDSAPSARTAQALYLLLGGVGLLLLSACANTANVMLATLTGRQREIAVCAALGAGRGRLVRQALIEALLLAFGGAALGTLVARLLLGAVIDVAPQQIARLTANTIDIDPRALAFAALLAAATALLCGVVPALRCAGQDPQEALAGSRSATDARNRRLRHGLVVAEVAMAMVLLVAAGVLSGSLARLLATDLGYLTDDLITVTIRPSSSRYPEGADRARLAQSLADRLRAVPGVERVAAASGLPISGVSSFSFDVEPEAEGAPLAEKDPDLVIPSIDAGDGYFATLGIPILAGAEFTAEQIRSDDPMVILGGSMAQRYFGDTNPVGRGFRLNADEPWRTVVGVAGEVATMDVPEPFGPFEMYRPFRFDDWSDRFALVVRVRPGAVGVAAAIRSAVAAEDPVQPIESIDLAGSALWNRLVEPRFYSTLAGTFALAALLLAGLGIYGVIAYSVAQRTREIGIRVALGAQRAHVRRLVLRLGVRLAGLGVAVGAVAALWMSRFLDAFVFGIDAADPRALALVAAAVLAIAMLACWVPLRRALRVHPAEALRAE